MLRLAVKCFLYIIDERGEEALCKILIFYKCIKCTLNKAINGNFQ